MAEDIVVLGSENAHPVANAPAAQLSDKFPGFGAKPPVVPASAALGDLVEQASAKLAESKNVARGLPATQPPGTLASAARMAVINAQPAPVQNDESENDPMSAPPADVFPRPNDTIVPTTEGIGEDAPPEVHTDPKAFNKWATNKREIKTLRQQLELKEQLIAEKERALAEAKSKPGELEELAATRQKLAAAEDKLGQVDITQSHAFQERYVTPLQRTYGQMQSLIQRSGQTPEQAQVLAQQIVQTNGDISKVQDLIAELPVAVQGAIVQNADSIVEMVRQQNEAVTKWRETKALLGDTTNRSQAAQSVETVVAATDKALSELTAEGNWVLTESPSNQAWNQQRDSLVRAARVVMREGRPDEVAKYVLAGVTADKYKEWGLQQHQRAEALQAELNQRIRTRPNLGGSVSDFESTSPAPVKPARVSPDNWLDRNLSRIDPNSFPGQKKR